jgi:hypothetical protein
MKFWIKILIAFCIVLVIGFAVWAFFFREKDEVVAYNQISELVEYKESTALRVKLDKLEKMNYLKNEASNVISGDSETVKEIIDIRNRCLSKEDISVYDAENTYLFEYSSYYTIDEYTNNFIEYLLPYMDNIEGSGSLLRKLKSSKKDYISSLKKTNEAIDLVVECQTTISGSSIEYDVLLGKYRSLAIELRSLLNNSANVMNNMLAYYKSAKGGDIYTSTYVSLNDAFVRTLFTMTSVEKIYELDYANDLNYITTKIDKYKNNENIFTTEFTELNFLNAYRNLFNENADVLNDVFSKKYILKKQMADNQNLSEVPEKLHHNVVVILNVLGY